MHGHGMRPFGELLPLEAALDRLLAAVHPVPRVDVVPLREARGRVAARAGACPQGVPPFARATMDGYALRHGDAPGPGARLRLAGELPAGIRKPPSLAPGTALRIATGAPLPPGADAVVRVEDAAEEEDEVVVLISVRAGSFVEKAGADVARGDLLVGEGSLLTPARLGLLASAGIVRVAVVGQPRVALHTSGDEVVPPGRPLPPGAIHDANGASLGALLEGAGARVTPAPPLPDDRGALEAALSTAAEDHDLLVTTGGASVGRRDLVVDAVRAKGRVLFHGVRVKPGKPLLAGVVGGALVVGLPGNPTSALSNAHLFVLPVLRRLQGLPPVAPAAFPARLAREVRGEPDRFLVLPVAVRDGEAHPTFKGSGALTSLAGSDGWIGVAEGARLDKGAPVDVHPW